jgi:MATE family multidrug resistance protein
LVGAPVGLALCEIWEFGIFGIWMGLVAGTLVTTVLTLVRLGRSRPSQLLVTH